MDTVNVAAAATVSGDQTAVSSAVASRLQSIVADGAGRGRLSLVSQGGGLFRVEHTYLRDWGRWLVVVGLVLLALITLVTQGYLSWYTGISTYPYGAAEQVMIWVARLVAFLMGAVVPASMAAAGFFLGRKTDVCTVTVMQRNSSSCEVTAMGPTDARAATAIKSFIESL